MTAEVFKKQSPGSKPTGPLQERTCDPLCHALLAHAHKARTQQGRRGQGWPGQATWPGPRPRQPLTALAPPRVALWTGWYFSASAFGRGSAPLQQQRTTLGSAGPASCTVTPPASGAEAAHLNHSPALSPFPALRGISRDPKPFTDRSNSEETEKGLGPLGSPQTLGRGLHPLASLCSCIPGRASAASWPPCVFAIGWLSVPLSPQH